MHTDLQLDNSMLSIGVRLSRSLLKRYVNVRTKIIYIKLCITDWCICTRDLQQCNSLTYCLTISNKNTGYVNLCIVSLFCKTGAQIIWADRNSILVTWLFSKDRLWCTFIYAFGWNIYQDILVAWFAMFAFHIIITFW